MLVVDILRLALLKLVLPLDQILLMVSCLQQLVVLFQQRVLPDFSALLLRLVLIWRPLVAVAEAQVLALMAVLVVLVATTALLEAAVAQAIVLAALSAVLAAQALQVL